MFLAMVCMVLVGAGVLAEENGQMTAFDYAGLRDSVVIPLLRDFGKLADGVLLFSGAPTGTAYNPQPGADVPQPVKVVQTTFEKKDVDGSTIQKDDVKFIISPENVTMDPELANRITVDGITYQAVNVKPLKPGSVVMLWTVQARK